MEGASKSRSQSSRVKPLDQPWKYFGTHDQLDDICPFAFQYHPPTTVMAHGSFAFWGWLTLPEVQVAEQFIRFQANMTARRGGEPRQQPQDRKQ